jgi:hypothetical protein
MQLSTRVVGQTTGNGFVRQREADMWSSEEDDVEIFQKRLLWKDAEQSLRWIGPWQCLMLACPTR